jgi:NAD(P)-dependent dehydrogenase (short-subunit alcohol dehydrogenase family)
MRLKDKVAIVTGSSNGIGKRTARRFAEEGAKVVVSDVQDDLGKEVAERIRRDGGTAVYVRCDILQEQDIKSLVEAAVREYGKLDILVNNAMVNAAKTAVEATAEEFDRAMAGMPRANFLGAKYAIPHMVEAGGGSIICISSVHGILPASRSLGYEVGKASLLNFVRQVSVDYGPQNIRANAICPGYIQSRLEDEDPTPDTPRSRYNHQIYPLRRFGWPLDIANAALYLASDEARFVTGQHLAVDGGLTTQLQDDLAYRLITYLKENPDVLEGWERRG